VIPGGIAAKERLSDFEDRCVVYPSRPPLARARRAGPVRPRNPGSSTQYERSTILAMAKNTTSIRLPEDLIEALDERAAALGITRSQLIIEAVEQALEDRSAWSSGFLKAIGTPRSDLEVAVAEMMEAIRQRRSRSEAPGL